MHKQQACDAILMDCDIPESDGFQATIHTKVLEVDERRTSVIVSTASTEENHKCTAAGVNDRASNSLHPHMPRYTLKLQLSTSRMPSASAITSVSDELEAAQRMFGAGFSELSELFLNDSPKRIISMHVAAAENDNARIAKEAHSFSGGTISIGAFHLSALCRDLEMCCKVGMPHDITNRLTAIEQEYARIASKLQALSAASQIA